MTVTQVGPRTDQKSWGDFQTICDSARLYGVVTRTGLSLLTSAIVELLCPHFDMLVRRKNYNWILKSKCKIIIFSD
jgi:hypothetical protein